MVLLRRDSSALVGLVQPLGQLSFLQLVKYHTLSPALPSWSRAKDEAKERVVEGAQALKNHLGGPTVLGFSFSPRSRKKTVISLLSEMCTYTSKEQEENLQKFTLRAWKSKASQFCYIVSRSAE